MVFEESYLEGVYHIKPRILQDDRGFFFESYNDKAFAAQGLFLNFVQDNQSFSRKGVIRGMHFQRYPHAQGKLVRVAHGKALDVVVDLRAGSPTFGKADSFVLDATQNNMVWVPVGFAHGFEALEDCVLMYKCTDFYHKDSEGGVVWNDPKLDLPWHVQQPHLSEKDAALPLFDPDAYYF
ncbi:dTDP-4-dehydrorhamnose 3,5-epimerase [Catalinimonas alkaloidigena]|uniref:dTDP-4-dehydrorhamnose 3,5-epimerase n=1 Tax=Catalinimonas alkaloidigena TaxID=1075417 RepID=A0A1G9E2N5_9BACT|nr:dTDP-4-dehydrorhamnose 3,5-epimerase [Catalinimonas alkaloidigena]SDK70353.1 dTDP-4-dehydrorhamnose 3,5-epimerase [Catalinimonas alkaloidigena]